MSDTTTGPSYTAWSTDNLDHEIHSKLDYVIALAERTHVNFDSDDYELVESRLLHIHKMVDLAAAALAERQARH